MARKQRRYPPEFRQGDRGAGPLRSTSPPRHNQLIRNSSTVTCAL